MKYFTIAELCKSTTADRLGINNRCRQEHVTALMSLTSLGCTSAIGLTEITGCKFLSCRLCWLEL